MHYSISALAALATTAAASTQMQVYYYSDGSCRNYESQVAVSWSSPWWANKPNCYNYSYGNSMLLGNCYTGNGCRCDLYFQSNCQGTFQRIDDSHNCVGDAQGVKSFSCYYDVNYTG